MIKKELIRAIKNTDDGAWIAGSVSGLAGQVIYELLQITDLFLQNTTWVTAMRSLIPGIFSRLLSGLLLGVVFSVIISNCGLKSYADNLTTSIPLGFGYGILTWFIPLPAIMTVVLYPVDVLNPSIQHLILDNLSRHVVYGIIVGIVYPLIYRRYG